MLMSAACCRCLKSPGDFAAVKDVRPSCCVVTPVFIHKQKGGSHISLVARLYTIAGAEAAEDDGPAGVQGAQAALPRPREAGELHDADRGGRHCAGAGFPAVQRPVRAAPGAVQLTLVSSARSACLRAAVTRTGIRQYMGRGDSRCQCELVTSDEM